MALEPHVIGLVGATGDLAKRKLLPGLFHLHVSGLLPDECRIVGLSLDDLDDRGFRDLAARSIAEFARLDPSDEQGRGFLGLLSYRRSTDARAIADAAAAAERDLGAASPPRYLFHLAVPPGAAAAVVRELGDAGLTERTRVIMEKPFGLDLASARELDVTVHTTLDERQVFRIDHFLGKEAVQNILVMRFANGFLEPVWNRDHIDHVQIDVPEALGIEGRANFYERTGALRDMVVTHLFQVLGFVAMEPPVALDADSLRDETGRVFRSMRPLDRDTTVYGQYEGYRSEPGVAADSRTETLVATRVELDTWRWAGVPFFLRTGKAMPDRRQTVTVVFKRPPTELFPDEANLPATGNRLTLQLNDPPSVALSFLGKEPGPRLALDEGELDFSVGEQPSRNHLLAPYERLIHDALLGDQTLFTRADGVERLWEVAQPLLDHPPGVDAYPRRSWGPPAVDRLIAPRRWMLHS